MAIHCVECGRPAMPHSNYCSELCRVKPVGRAVGDVGTAASKGAKDIGASAGNLVGSLLAMPEASPELTNAYSRKLEEEQAKRGVAGGMVVYFAKTLAPIAFILASQVAGCMGLFYGLGWFAPMINVGGLVIGLIWVFRSLTG
jgi:hypothetical protein